MTARRYKVRWTSVAIADLENIATWLDAEAPLRAEQILDRIVERAESLSVLPERGRAIPEVRDVVRSWREVQEPPWRIVYRIFDGMVQVHGILDARRDLAELLHERILMSS